MHLAFKFTRIFLTNNAHGLTHIDRFGGITELAITRGGRKRKAPTVALGVLHNYLVVRGQEPQRDNSGLHVEVFIKAAPAVVRVQIARQCSEQAK